MKRFLVGAASLVLATVVGAVNAAASVKVHVDIGSQRMQVYIDGRLKHEWAVSTGRDGYETPTGSYRPQRLERE
ncbi:MAG TPA: L,D-transpeptidase, partial [Hyphomicrobiaceae bacterium]|nr:L,D-transpeptidase [Hyphomicrobiaceae bacterium]